jgi:hypothetical protein
MERRVGEKNGQAEKNGRKQEKDRDRGKTAMQIEFRTKSLARQWTSMIPEHFVHNA